MLPIHDRLRPARPPHITRALIAANIGVFIYQITSDYTALIRSYAFYPALFLANEQHYRLLTSMFLHADLLHLGGNMLFLYVFGDNVEGRFGRPGFLALYLFTGVVASVGHTLWALYQDVGSLVVPAVGASGAISGVLGAYAVLYPHSRILTLLFIRFFVQLVEIPAFLYLGLWFLYQLLLGSLGLGGGVAYWAHVSGFMAGAILGLLARLR